MLVVESKTARKLEEPIMSSTLSAVCLPQDSSEDTPPRSSTYGSIEIWQSVGLNEEDLKEYRLFFGKCSGI